MRKRFLRPMPGVTAFKHPRKCHKCGDRATIHTPDPVNRNTKPEEEPHPGLEWCVRCYTERRDELPEEKRLTAKQRAERAAG